MKISLKDIKEDKLNFNYMSMDEYDTLKNSISLRGIREDIKLRLNPLNKSEYIIIDGHYRIRVLRDLKFDVIPNKLLREKQIKIYSDMNEEKALTELFDNNIKGRKNPLKYIRYLEYCMKALNINRVSLAKLLGISKSRLSNRLAITKSKSKQLKHHLRNWEEYLIKTKGLTLKHLEQLSRLNNEPTSQYGIYETYIFDEGVSANRLKQIIDERVNIETKIPLLKREIEAKKVESRLNILEVTYPEVAKIVREYWYPLRYKNIYNLMEEEIKIRIGQPKRREFFLPVSEYTEEEAREYVKRKHGEYLEVVTRSWHRIYIIPTTIEELRKKGEEKQ